MRLFETSFMALAEKWKFVRADGRALIHSGRGEVDFQEKFPTTFFIPLDCTFIQPSIQLEIEVVETGMKTNMVLPLVIVYRISNWDDYMLRADRTDSLSLRKENIETHSL